MALMTSPLWQLAGIVLTVSFAVTMGIIVGFIVSRMGTKEEPYDDQEEFSQSDENY
jgi:uncharacterized membrane-anchored protein YhcB (DUF1043 family)